MSPFGGSYEGTGIERAGTHVRREVLEVMVS